MPLLSTVTRFLNAGRDIARILHQGAVLWQTGAAPTGPLTLSPTHAPAPAFPISISGRGYRDALARPFVGVADTLWNACSRMTLAEVESYAQTRRAQGYTMVLVSLLDINSRSRAQVTTGELPFTGTNNAANFAAPNDIYFDAAVAKIDALVAAGLYVWVVPGWYGWQGDMWRSNWGTGTSDYSKADPYADYLAVKLGGRQGVGWLHGGDNGPTTSNGQTGSVPSGGNAIDVTQITNRFAGRLRAAASASQLHSYHTYRGDRASTYFGSESWYDVHAAYAAADVPAQTVPVYALGSKPVALTEAYYELRAETGLSAPHLDRFGIRRTLWQGITTGALLHASGNEAVWQVRGFRGSHVWDQADGVTSAFSENDVSVLSRVLATFPTVMWTPDAAAPLVSTNRGGGITLAPALISDDGGSAILYVPTARTFTVDLTRLAAGRAGLWVHPQTGETREAILTGSLTTPTGWSDAVLLLGNAGLPPVDPPGPVLPVFGFSLNGTALSGPIDQAHYDELGQFTPGPVWARIGVNEDGSWQSVLDEMLVPARSAGMKILLRASFRSAVYSGAVPLDGVEQARYGTFMQTLAEYVVTAHGLTPDDVVFEYPNESNGRVSGTAYALAAADAYPKLKTVDPGFKVIGASENVYAAGWMTWLEDV